MRSPASALIALCLALIPVGVRAEQLPLWEAGVGLSGLNFPDYRGSDERTTLVLPFPYVIYRGEHLRLDREGLRGLFFESDRVELDVSVNAGIPVNSDDNAARKGMPDLDPTVEIGPSLNVTLLGNRREVSELQLRLPVRAVIATDLSSASTQGFVFEPRLNLDLRWREGGEGWRGGIAAGPVFATDRYARYYYSVAPQYATPARPAYAASGGYAGSQLTLSLTWRGGSYWVGGFVRQDWLAGASYENSPLVKSDYALAAGIGIAYIFARSSRTVEAYD